MSSPKINSPKINSSEIIKILEKTPVAFILLITYLLNIFDLAMTTLWVKLYGISVEANPIGRWLFTHNIAWVVKIFFIGGLLAAIGVCIRKHPKAAWVAYVPLGVYGVLTVYHVIIASIVF